MTGPAGRPTIFSTNEIHPRAVELLAPAAEFVVASSPTREAILGDGWEVGWLERDAAGGARVDVDGPQPPDDGEALPADGPAPAPGDDSDGASRSPDG